MQACMHAMVDNNWRRSLLEKRLLKNVGKVAIQVCFNCLFSLRLIQRRIASSWRFEYSLRTNLLRVWSNGKHSNLMFEPQIGQIEKLNVDFKQGRLMAASTVSGLVAICDPRTGRVNKDQIHCSIDDTSNPVSCVKISLTQIYIGHLNGRLSAISNYKDGGSFVSRRPFTDLHSSTIKCLECITSKNGLDILVISGSHSTIKVWDASSLVCLQILVFQGDLHSIAIDIDNGMLLALSSNSVFVWNDLDFKKMSRDAPKLPSLTIDFPEKISCFTLLYDAPSCSLFVPVGSEVLTFDLKDGIMVAKFTGHSFPISSTCWDTEIILSSVNIPRRLCVIATGDVCGQVFLWDARKLVEKIANDRLTSGGLQSLKEDPHTFKPNQIYNGHISKIQALDIDAFKLVSISFDGYIKVWDLVTGECIRNLHSKYFKSQPSRRRLEEISQNQEANERRAVRCMVTSLHQIVIGAGSEVRVWDFDPEQQLESFRKPFRKSNISKKIKGFTSPRSILQFDAKKDLKESNKMLQQERAENEHREKLYNKMSIKNLTEKEMIDYAMMLSMEQNTYCPLNSSILSHYSSWNQPKPTVNDISDFPPLSVAEKPYAKTRDRSSSKSITMENDIDHLKKTMPISILDQGSLALNVPNSKSLKSQSILSPSSSSSRQRKISLSEFMSGSRERFSSSFESAPPVSSSIGITSSSYSNVWQGNIGSSHSMENNEDFSIQQPLSDSDEQQDEEAYFSNLRSSGGFGAGILGGGSGSSHSGYRRRLSSQPANEWSSVQVVPHPGRSRESQEDEELQYALELSMIEK